MNVRDQNLGGLQSLCHKTESKVVFSVFFLLLLLFSCFWLEYFVALQYEAEPMQEKGLSLDGGRFQSCFNVLYFEMTVRDSVFCVKLKTL